MTLEELAALRDANRVEVPPELLARYPDAYVLLCTGVCMRPTFWAGDVIMASPSAPLQPNSIVIVYNGEQHFLKHLVAVPPPYATLPAVATEADPKPTVLLKEHASPGKTFHWKAEEIVSIHAAVGFSRRGLMPMKALLP